MHNKQVLVSRSRTPATPITAKLQTYGDRLAKGPDFERIKIPGGLDFERIKGTEGLDFERIKGSDKKVTFEDNIQVSQIVNNATTAPGALVGGQSGVMRVKCVNPRCGKLSVTGYNNF